MCSHRLRQLYWKARSSQVGLLCYANQANFRRCCDHATVALTACALPSLAADLPGLVEKTSRAAYTPRTARLSRIFCCSTFDLNC